MSVALCLTYANPMKGRKQAFFAYMGGEEVITSVKWWYLGAHSQTRFEG